MDKGETVIVRYGGVLLGAAAAFAWVAVVIASGGWDWNPSGIAWNFERTGQLGDSFGVLSSAMAAVAAYYAFRTFQSARADAEELRRRAAEPSYLNLLERRFDMLDRVRVTGIRIAGLAAKEIEWHGQAAVDRIAARLQREFVEAVGLTDLSNVFFRATNDAYGLPNLYRFTYHIVAYAERQFSRLPANAQMTKEDPAYKYVRLLRAQLSDSEQLLIALNCAFGEGHEKFKPLVERFALLHNINFVIRESFGLDSLLEPAAFGLTPEDRVPLPDSPELGGRTSDRPI